MSLFDVAWNPFTGCAISRFAPSMACHICDGPMNAKRSLARVTTHNVAVLDPGDGLTWAGHVVYGKSPKRVFVAAHKAPVIGVCTLGDFFYPGVDKSYRYDVALRMLELEGRYFFISTRFLAEATEWLISSPIASELSPRIILAAGVANQEEASLASEMLALFPSLASRALLASPMLGPINPGELPYDSFDWVIIGGPKRVRDCVLSSEWVRDLLESSLSREKHVTFEGWGEWYPASTGPPFIASADHASPSIRGTRVFDSWRRIEREIGWCEGVPMVRVKNKGPATVVGRSFSNRPAKVMVPYSADID